MLTLTNGMLLYHGSFIQVSEIDLSKCKQGKDFGRGFYVTSSYKQAQGFVPLSVNKQVNEGKVLEVVMDENAFHIRHRRPRFPAQRLLLPRTSASDHPG